MKSTYHKNLTLHNYYCITFNQFVYFYPENGFFSDILLHFFIIMENFMGNTSPYAYLKTNEGESERPI